MKKIILSLAIIICAMCLLISCDSTEKAKLTSLELDTTEAKVVYVIGEDFLSNGIKVTAIFSDNSKKSVDLTNLEIDSSLYNKQVAGEYSITVSYTLDNIKKSGSYKVTVVEPEIVMSFLEIDASKAIVNYVIGDDFNGKDLEITIVYSDGSKAKYAASDYVVDSSNYQKDVIGTYTINVSLTIENVLLKGSYNVVVESNIVTIDSIDKFLEMRNFANAEGYNTKEYTLGCDIDLTGVTLEPTNTIFSGKLDGKGYTIKNGTFNQNTSKQGMLFAKVDGAIIENIKFFACSVIGGASETVAIIAGECNNTGATFENLEFSCCTVNNDGQNYAALIIGRNETKVVELTFSNITVKNLTSVTSNQYAGVLIGDVIKNSIINAKNCDIDVTINAANNISVFSGRNRGATVNVNDSIVKLELGNKTTSSSTQIGVFADGNATSIVNATNVAILKFGVTTAISTSSDMVSGRNNNLVSTILNNVYYITENCDSVTGVTGINGISEVNLNTEWFINTLLLKVTDWEEDSNKMIKLIVATPNTPMDGATIKTLKLVTASVDKQFFKGDSFTSDGLLVTAIYSDGCVIALDNYEVKILNSLNAEISTSDFLTASVGEYSIIITSGEASESYKIMIVEEVGIAINSEFVKKVYVVGEELNLDDLFVFVQISDNSEVLLDAKEYEISVSTMENVKPFELVGDYTVEIKRGDFIDSYDIIVINTEEIKPIINVYVSDKHSNGEIVDGNYYFVTIKEALDYLTSLVLSDEVVKNIYLSEGEYVEKLTFDMANVNLIGQTDNYEKVIISYSAASGTIVPSKVGTYGTDECATVIITANAFGFTASNIYFKNNFDYNNSTLANKQGLAVRCDADEVIFNYCGFYGNQDTLEAKTGRQYYYHCIISGNVDFIFGNNATAVFETCTIKSITRYTNNEPVANNGYVCAPKGYSKGVDVDKVKYNFVFLNCSFIAEDDVLAGSMSIARPWGVNAGVTSINCSFSSAYSTLGYDGTTKSRYFDMSGISPIDAFFFEYGNTGEGSTTEEVAGMKLLTEAEAALYTLVNIFANPNGLVTYTLGDWIISENPSENVFTKLIISYELGSSEYKQNDKFIDSEIKVWELVGNSINGYKQEDLSSSEKVYDEDDVEVEIATALTKAGKYTIKLFVKDNIVATRTFNVIANDAVTTTKTLLASDEVESSVTQGKSYVDGIFSIYGKLDGSAVSVSSCTATDGTNDYTKLMKITGGKASIDEATSTPVNCIKIVIEKAGKITVVASQKNALAANKDVKLVVLKSDGSTLLTSTTLLAATDDKKMSVVEFNIEEAGTYYIGTDTNGFHLYSISYSYEEIIKKQEVKKTLLASDEAESSVTQGKSYVNGIFSIYGKLDGSAVSVSSCTVTDGTNNYTKLMKISGGKVSIDEATSTPVNCVKVVVEAAGKITVVASQKNALAANKDVKLVVLKSDGSTLLTSATLLAAIDDKNMSTVEFAITEAGTYYIGTDTNGFYLYSITYSYME